MEEQASECQDVFSVLVCSAGVERDFQWTEVKKLGVTSVEAIPQCKWTETLLERNCIRDCQSKSLRLTRWGLAQVRAAGGEGSSPWLRGKAGTSLTKE